MSINPHFLRTVCVCLGFVWPVPCPAQAAAYGEHAQAQANDSSMAGVSVHARIPPSVMIVRARVVPACLVTVDSGDAPSIHCTHGVDWREDVRADVPMSLLPEETAVLPLDDCVPGSPAVPCLIVEF